MITDHQALVHVTLPLTLNSVIDNILSIAL